MKKIMFVFGTRPEFIKIYPVILEAQNQGNKVCIVNTGQHREMVNQLIEYFNCKIDYDLAIMDKVSNLTEIISETLIGVDKVIKKEKPDLVLVHGDTAATVAGTQAAFYNQVKIGHIEAGLRTFDKYSPFPEEINRKMVGTVADYHFAPTNVTANNLKNEGIKENIFVVGNSAIDMLQYTIQDDYYHSIMDFMPEKKIILLTAHRRENIDKLEEIFSAINEVAKKYYDTHKIIYPIHLNPVIREKAAKTITQDNIKIIEPLDTVDFHNIMNVSDLILTDSGGIQEEAPSLGKPVLVLRDTTERPEGVKAGSLKLIGTKSNDIITEVTNLLDNTEEYEKMAMVVNPYGDGTTSKQIISIINEEK